MIAGVIVGTWIERGFGELSEERLAGRGPTLVIVGLQVFFSSFLLSILGSAAPRRRLDGYLGQASRAPRRYRRR